MTRTVVEFFDITTHDGWLDEDETHVPILCTAIGKVVREDENLITLASLYAPGRTGYLIIVPKGCIVTRQDF